VHGTRVESLMERTKSFTKPSDGKYRVKASGLDRLFARPFLDGNTAQINETKEGRASP